MKKNLHNKISEELIIKNYLNKLNFNKEGTYNFNNDASFIKLKKNKKLVVTTDSISEDIDFFKYDDAKSIANKIISINLSDLSAMGVRPYSYTLNLFLPKYIDSDWLKQFTNKLLQLQKKFNFFLLGGDLSKSKKLSISSTFFGFSKNDKIVSQNTINLNDDIWITGNIGESFIGLQILKHKIKLENKHKKYFLNKYYYPKVCTHGYAFAKFSNSMKDISDGFFGDLKKMLNSRFGAKLYLKSIPLSTQLNKIISNKLINIKNVLNSGDNYQLIIISNKKFRSAIFKTAKKYKIKISRVGKITKKKNIVDDSNNILNIPKEFDHFL